MNLRSYVVVTGAYWAFTVTDGALRMLVLLYFHDLGYSPLSLALLFLLYEFFGVFTNLIGGWVGTNHGLNRTLVAGLGLQIAALLVLTLHEPEWREWLAVGWVMGAQALSGIAKDLTKMSAKSAVKFVAPDGKLFRLVAILTGSKNALKGVGFFVGAALLGWLDFRGALLAMAVALGLVLVLVTTALGDVGRATTRPALASVLKKSSAIQRLSAARFFLFGSRDIWFVVALPVFLDDMLGWSYEAIGAFLACWVIGYGLVQSLAPRLLASVAHTPLGAFGFLPPMAATAMFIAVSVWTNELQALITVVGLLGFGVMFALTSSVHSYLVLAYSTSEDETALDVGFYYSANAAGRLVGTLLSGMLFLIGGFGAALVGTAVFLVAAFIISLGLPPVPSDTNDRVDVAVP
ncbi:MAG: organoarsenical effux MFS transporter ArsJ [Acidimicrobiaceae bacterium]|nr:organoarsenical effux MFS transporter ArsJ [Acidimicrobiaceae bacterium]